MQITTEKYNLYTSFIFRPSRFASAWAYVQPGRSGLAKFCVNLRNLRKFLASHKTYHLVLFIKTLLNIEHRLTIFELRS
jgi:hypothetical protein